jgi:hypothetical protein
MIRQAFGEESMNRMRKDYKIGEECRIHERARDGKEKTREHWKDLGVD